MDAPSEDAVYDEIDQTADYCHADKSPKLLVAGFQKDVLGWGCALVQATYYPQLDIQSNVV